jgi:hypothetical protein
MIPGVRSRGASPTACRRTGCSNERIRRVLQSACLVTTFLLSVATLGATGATTDRTPAASIAQDVESLLTFVGGEPLTSAEHDRVTAETRDAFLRFPQATGRADSTIKQLLGTLPALDQPTAEAVREELRVRFALVRDSPMVTQILENHDPSIAIDRDNEAVVTSRTIVTIRLASQWMAKQVGIAGPNDDFVSSETKYFRGNFSTFTAEQQAACTHIARNMAAGIVAFDNLTSGERETRLARVRSAITASTPLDKITVLGMAAAYVDTTSFENKMLSTFAEIMRLRNLDNVATALGGHI